MQTRWKILGGTGVASVWAAALIIGQSGVVHGDDESAGTTSTDTASSTASAAAAAQLPHDPNTPYPLGPGAIPYEKLSAADKAAVDKIEETVETSQPASSYQGWAAATAWTGQQADAEIAARGVGLVGTDSDGVVP